MGYILNFQNNFNNMKNEIIRKITSLTLMTIMFAGGLTLAVPSFAPMDEILPAAYAENSANTVGMLSLSSVEVQGAQVIEIIVDDPSISNIYVPHTNPEVDIVSGTTTSTLLMTQVIDGTWVAYVADLSAATDADSASFNFGTPCTTTLAVPEGFSDNGLSSFLENRGSNDNDDICDNPDEGSATSTPFTVLQNELKAVPKGTATANSAVLTVGNAGHDSESWPMIFGVDFSSDNVATYGDDSMVFTYGAENAGSDIIVNNGQPFVVQGQNLAVTIVDNGLNIDPTTAETWTFGSVTGTTTVARTTGDTTDIRATLGITGFGDNGVLAVTDSDVAICAAATSGCTGASTYVFIETGLNTGVFEAHDAIGESVIDIKGDAAVDETVTFSYGGSSVMVTVATNNASASLDAGANWAPGEAAVYTVTDADMNRNASLAEELRVQDDNVIPTIIVGSPKYLLANDINYDGNGASTTLGGIHWAASDADSFGTGMTATDMGDGSKRVKLTTTASSAQADSTLTINTKWDASTFNPCTSGTCADSTADNAGGQVLSYDICSLTDYLGSTVIAVTMDQAQTQALDAMTEEGSNVCAGEISSTEDGEVVDCDASCTVQFAITHDSIAGLASEYVIAMDLNNFRQGEAADAIYRIAAVETGPDTGVFEGTVTYNLMNTANQKIAATPVIDAWTTAADNIDTNSSDVTIMLDNYQTGTSGIEVTYGDTDVLGAANVTVSPPRLDANTHNGVLSWDQVSYAVGDAATVTVVDADLNTDSSVVEVYLGDGSYTAGTDIFAVTCDDAACTNAATIKLVEDGVDSDTFVGIFTVTDDIGTDMEIGYRDSRDAAGVATIWYATATIGSTTGTISLDRQVYPVPFDKEELKEGDNTVLNDFNGDGVVDDDGDVTITISVTDPDETGTTIAKSTAPGTIKFITSGTTGTLGTFGGTNAAAATTANQCNDSTAGCEYGPMTEIEQGSNVYEIAITLDETNTMTVGNVTHQILGGQTVIQVQYADPNGDNGLATTVYDSSTFDLRNGSLTTDKSVYVMGQTMVITISDPDLDLDSATAETYSLGLIEWDSDADSSELLSTAAFTKNPTNLEETGDGTGVFQTTVDIPTGVSDAGNANALELGEVITLTYRDSGLAGETQVNADSADVEATIAISNFGATITLDKTVYDWTDDVNIEVVAPDHNKNSAGKETIGTAALPVKISTRSGALCSSTYTLKESGEDTGIFTGYITLQGVESQAVNPSTGSGTFDAGTTFCDGSASTATGGPENGTLQTAGQDDGVTVTFEYNDGSVAVASAIIQWNYSTIEWLSSNVSTTGNAVIRVTDPDEDLDNTIVDQITIDVYSDSDSGGVQTTLSETDEATGVFEGIITFTADGISSGDTVRVSEGDTVTAEVTDYTLPGPDYTSSDTLLFAATTTVGTAFPPLDRAPAANARVVDASGNSVAEVSSGQQVQIAADVTNGQSKDQAFAYLVQVQDASGVTVSLSWLTGSLTSGQSMTAAQSWTPTDSGSYTATVFVWESVSNPTALSPTVSVNIDVV